MHASLPIAEERPAIRVLIVENSSFQREGVQSLIRPYRDLEIIGVAWTKIDVLDLAARTPPDVLVINLYPDFDITRILRDLRQRLQVPTLVLVNSADHGAARALRAAGADELLFGFVRPPLVIDAIRRLGQAAIDTKVAMANAL